jgi:hypothetical protein
MAKVRGKGTTLSYCATIDGVYTAFADIISVAPPQTTVAKIDTTHLGLTSNARAAEPGWISCGETTCVIHYVAADHVTNRALLGVEKYFKVTYSDNSYDVFLGHISNYGAVVERAGLVTATITVRTSGKITFTAA